jgi:hypothetical protein
MADFFQREFQLRAAIAALRSENVTCEALGVNAHERNRFLGFKWTTNFAANQRYGFVLRSRAAKTVDRKASITGRQFRLRDHFKGILSVGISLGAVR